MFLVSEDFQYHNISCYIHPSIKSDHSIIKIYYINIGQWARGQGFYKLNTVLLKDNEYMDKMNIKLSNLYGKSIFFANKALFWDYVKCEIRRFSLSYSSYKAIQNKQ